MKTIVKGKEKICRVMGRQQIRDVRYRLLKYLLRVECEDGLLLQNMITGELVLLTGEEAGRLASLPAKPDDTLLPLIGNFFLVPEDYNEKDTVLVLRTLLKRLFPAKGINGYMILPTTNCNAGCAYCFEHNVGRKNMDDQTAESIVDYISSKKGPGPVSIHWFGGEPLLGMNQIDHICSLLKERNIEFSSKMTSNGYLFDERIAEKAVREWKLRQVQITLDGTEDNYNSIKSYNNAQSSPYRKVLKNISLLLKKGIEVKLRLSLTSGNADDLDKLIDELESMFKGSSGLYPYIGIVSEEFLPVYNGTGDCEPLSKERVLEYQALSDRIESIWPSKPAFDGLLVTKCMADDDGSAAIMPDGKLQKCENIIEDSNAYGSIYSEEENKEKRLKYKEKLEFDRCGDCPLYPGCIILKECIPVRRINDLYCKCLVEQSERKLLHQYTLIASEETGAGRFEVHFDR